MTRWEWIDGEWVQLEEYSGGSSRLDVGPDTEPLDNGRVRDWSKAVQMITDLEVAPNMDTVESWDDAITVVGGNGRTLFRYRSDGTVEVPHESDLPEAAVIFFRNVVEIANAQGYEVKGLPQRETE